MASVRVTVEGTQRLKAALARYEAESVQRISDAVVKSALQVQGDAQRLIQRGTRSGQPTTRYNPKRQVTPSAPGEPPKTDQGRLVGSIDFETDADRLGAAVGTNLTYGKYLEFGARKMAARPWLFPTFERLKPAILKRISAALRAAKPRR